MRDYRNLLNILIEATRIMYDAIWDEYNRVSKTNVTLSEIANRVDNASASALENYLEEIDFKPRVISEEGFKTYNPKEDVILIVDPIDGTTNFVRGIPFSSISLALSRGNSINDIFIGVIKDIFRGDLFHAIKGMGSFLNNTRIHVSKVKSTAEAYISICINRAKPGRSSELNILPLIPYARHFGSAALEGAYVACGKIDLHVDVRGALRVFDIAASQLLVKEAGGKVLVWQNRSTNVDIFKIHGISIIEACSPHLLERAMDFIKI